MSAAAVGAWLQGHGAQVSIAYGVVSLAAAFTFARSAMLLLRSSRKHLWAMNEVFREARTNLINATTRGLEERVAALEKIVMDEHLDRIERASAAAPPEGEARG